MSRRHLLPTPEKRCPNLRWDLYKSSGTPMMRQARLRGRAVMKKQAVKKHSIEISFPKAGAGEAGSFAKSLHQYLTTGDLKQSGIAIALTSPTKAVGTPMVKLEFD